jgi:type I restriction enzyme M protein
MAVKKSDLYSSLWKSCDELRGGMDASQYKDYVLVLLFMKYVSDRAKEPGSDLEVPDDASFEALVALKGDKEIGDKVNKVIGRLATVNGLEGVIDVTDFNDDQKLGKDQEMVDRISSLIGIFENEALDFSGNQTGGDDLLGDAYEFLMRNFATESGKSKGQFYTPAEVSRIMASVIGLDRATSQTQTIHDPTCGSGSLLLKAHDAARSATGLDLAIYGQEMDNPTSALARMNMWLHDAGTAEIWNGNTLSAPHFLGTDEKLKTFDFVVANPPFSSKSWSNGVNVAHDPYARFQYGVPPAKNGDFAFLLHVIACLKSTGKGAIILPHGVLFRPNAEAGIRREIIRRGFIKGIIGLPPNLFYGTGIAACVLILDKEGAATRKAIFMVDASRGFAKDGAKNRLRERDIHRIVDVFRNGEEVEGYSRLVPISEIAAPDNNYNLNLPRYVDSTEVPDIQDLEAHLRGGIPDRDIDKLDGFWRVMPTLRDQLFSASDRTGYSDLRVGPKEILASFAHSDELATWKATVDATFTGWAASERQRMLAIDASIRPKVLASTMADKLLSATAGIPLLDPYAIFQRFMEYWEETMSDDVHMVVNSGWVEASKPMKLLPKSKERVDFVVGKAKCHSDLLPSSAVAERFMDGELAALASAEALLADAETELDELLDEYGGEGSPLEDAVGDKGKFTKARIRDATAAAVAADDEEAETARDLLRRCADAFDLEVEARAKIKATTGALNGAVAHRYDTMTATEVAELVVDDKWLKALVSSFDAEVTGLLQGFVLRISQLAERYQVPLPVWVRRSSELEERVESHLVSMGLKW